MNTFLSIDLDYWNSDYFPKNGILSSRLFLRKVAQLDVPMHWCFDHRAMAGLVSASPARRLINVDFHSDLDSESRGQRYHSSLDCGNWVNHVTWRHEPQAIYVWKHPNEDPYDGWCHGYTRDDEFNPFQQWGYRAFGTAKHSHGLRNIPWSKISGVAIAISPDYLVGDNVYWLLKRLFPYRYEMWEREIGHKYNRYYQRITCKTFANFLYTHMHENKYRDVLEHLNKDLLR